MNALRGKTTVAACAAMTFVLGSIHAFSVFMPEWETLPGGSRAGVSLIYSVALVSLTSSVLVGYRVYSRVPPSSIFLLAGVGAAAGLVLSARSESLGALYWQYGVLFGGANGLGYGYALQLAGQACPRRRGMAMGLVTAFYAVGATVAPFAFVFLIEHGGNALALVGIGGLIFTVSVLAAFILWWNGSRYKSEPPGGIEVLPPVLRRARRYLWIGYGSAVAGGLMVIGHAYGIALWMHVEIGSAASAPMSVALGNMLGGFSAGFLSDRLSSRSMLRWLPLITSLGIVLVIFPWTDSFTFSLFGLGAVGYSYGALIAVYPVAIADVFGVRAAPKVYGQIFTAWGFAGLAGPWASGSLFDKTGSYTVALTVAAVLSGVSIVAIRFCLPSSYNWAGSISDVDAAE
jgi:MFS family permease